MMLATRTLLSQTARRSTSQVSRAGASSILTSTSSSILAAPRFTQPRGAVGQQSRQFSSSRMTMAASLGPGNIIQPSDNDPVQITSLTPSAGFTLSDGLVVPSPIILFGGALFMWDVGHPTTEKDKIGRGWDGWNEEKLKVFEAMSPRPEILLVGTGKTTCFPPPAFKKYLNGLGIQVDVLDSRNAASTYNLLSEEGRQVAAALYPISELKARTGIPK